MPASKPTSLTVNKDNYYSLDTSFKYQSATWFKKFLTCEAEAMAELQGKWTPRGDPTALLVGNYLHSYFESKQAHESFIKKHPEMFSTRGSSKGQLKAPYKQADAMIATLEADENVQRLYQGEKEEILTGDLFGVEWMGKLDCFDSTKSFFLDLKTTQSLHKKYWKPGERQPTSFVDAYNYQLQMAVYQELIYQNYGTRPRAFIIAVTKEDVPDHAVIEVPQYRMDEALEEIQNSTEHVEAVKSGQVRPHRCEKCDYCRATKKVATIISMDELVE